MDSNGIEFSQMYTYGAHMYRRAGQIAEIIFEKSKINL